MHITRTHSPLTQVSFWHPALEAVSEASLRSTVEALAYPRDYIANRRANERARDWIAERLCSCGYAVSYKGAYDNVIAERTDAGASPRILLAAHYDTVPNTPGADDNGSGIALCLEAARVLASFGQTPVTIAIFNREEDGLLGSTEFVAGLSADERLAIAEAHIFEMVGYFSDEPNSQSKPVNLPIAIPDVGDFIGIISNRCSNQLATQVRESVKQLGSNTPLLSLKTFFGIERLVGDLLRSVTGHFKMHHP